MKNTAFSICKTIFLLFLCFFFFLCSPVFVEASTKTISIDTSRKEIYANGLAITLESGSESNTKIRYSNGSEEVYHLFEDKDEADLREYTVYGGFPDQKCSSSNITMNGGFVNEIYGAARNQEVDDCHITMNGGSVFNLFGGGKEFSGQAKTTSVRVTGGKVRDTVYGGGRASKVTESSTIHILGGQIRFVYGGGHEQNAYVTSTFVYIEGGQIQSSVSAGSMKSFVPPAESTAIISLPLRSLGGFTHLLYRSEEKLWRVQGHPVIPKDMEITISEGQKLHIPAGTTLTNHGTLRCDGIIEGEGALLGDGRFFQSLKLDNDLQITNKGVATDTFTYGDQVDLKVKPAASGAHQGDTSLPINQLDLFLRKEDGTLFPISEPVCASADGYFYFHHDTSNKLLALGSNTLSLLYAGSETVRPAAHEVTVTLKAQPIQKTQDLSFTLHRDASFSLPTFQSPSGETLSGTTNYFRGDTPCTYEEILAFWKNSSQRAEQFRYTFTPSGYYTGTISGQITLNLPDDRPSYSGVYRISIDERHRQIDDADTAGYFAAMPHKVIVKNTGNRSTGKVNIRLSKGSDSAFELSQNHLGSIARGKNASFSILPKIGLPVGVYEERFFLSGSRSLSASGTIRFVVQADENTSKKTYQDWSHNHHAIPLDKTWTIRLNRPLDKNSVHHAHLFLTAASRPQEKIPAQLLLSEDHKEIRLIPAEPLKPSAHYTLWIQGLQSEDGRLLKTPIRMDFETVSE